jgi:RNA recognition motif-containing protein
MSSVASSSDSSSSPQVKRKRVAEECDDAAHETDTADNAPVPDDSVVLSHAEKRRQKKKDEKARDRPSKKRKVTDSSVADVSAKDSKSAGNSKPKRQNSVWVGNLWFKTTPDALRDFFDGVGEITRIHMPTKKGTKGENMGFAYVDFATPDAKVTAITQSERELHGRNLLVKDGNDFAGRPITTPVAGTQEDAKGPSAGKSVSGLTKTQQKILRVQKQPPAQTLFLGNLGFDTTVESIRELFEAHRHSQKAGKGVKANDAEASAGEDNDVTKDVWLRKIRMGTFEDSGACKGFAFLDFTSTEHATAALINPRNHRLNGRDLVVEYASADAVRRGGGPRSQSEHKSGPGKRHGGRQPDAESRPRTQSRPGRRGENEKEHSTQQDDAESIRRNQKEAPRHIRADRVRGRPKPGAALAQAPRESAAIIPSQGQKIVF